MKSNICFWLGVVYILFWTILASFQVGKIVECGHNYTVWLPFTIFIIVVSPFILGFIAGKFDQ